MKIDSTNSSPIFVQIAEGIEDGILSGAFPEDTRIPSTTEISSLYKINPATALKGINLLVSEGFIYKKRGLGMFVTLGAVKMIKKKRQDTFVSDFISPLIKEALRLDISSTELLSILENHLRKDDNNELY
ncbi:MAG: GntR family transcriptional regulator [Tissierellia bacterium]|nr:GntR family transcriptional regulator [Tissierellia bacterium]